MNQTKLQWKKLSEMTPHQILFDQNNQLFLKNILSYQISEFEIDNLPSSYIISFIQILQNYIYYYMQNSSPQNYFLSNTNINDTNDLEKIISSKDEQIENLRKKLIEYQISINQKDILLNDANNQLYILSKQFNQLEKEYKEEKAKYEKELKEYEDNYKEMDQQFLDTFQYLNNLFIVSGGQVKKKGRKLSENVTNKLNMVRTYNHESNNPKGDLLRKNRTSSIKDKNFHLIMGERKNEKK